MSEKQVIVTLEDGFGRVQTSIATSLSAPQLMDKIMEIDEQQSTIEELKEENSNLNSILNEVGLQKPFIKILDDYMIEYDGSCFSMHRPSDIRSFVYLMNRNNNFDELQCEYNDESMVIDDE